MAKKSVVKVEAGVVEAGVVEAGVGVVPEVPVETPPVPTVLRPVAAGSFWVLPTGEDKPVHPNRHTGRYSGMGIEQFQNELYILNRDRFVSVAPDGTERLVGLTDYELAILWAVEFPGARCDYMRHTDYVASTRTSFVNGRHPSHDPRAVGCGVTYGVDGNLATKPVRVPTKVAAPVVVPETPAETPAAE